MRVAPETSGRADDDMVESTGDMRRALRLSMPRVPALPVSDRVKRRPVNIQSEPLADHSERDPPSQPDCTARASVWESRKLPGLKQKASKRLEAFLLWPVWLDPLPPIW
jgi:hypothetical protein